MPFSFPMLFRSLTWFFRIGRASQCYIRHQPTTEVDHQRSGAFSCRDLIPSSRFELRLNATSCARIHPRRRFLAQCRISTSQKVMAETCTAALSVLVSPSGLHRHQGRAAAIIKLYLSGHRLTSPHLPQILLRTHADDAVSTTSCPDEALAMWKRGAELPHVLSAEGCGDSSMWYITHSAVLGYENLNIIIIISLWQHTRYHSPRQS
jgi:hypothetical protein